MSKEFSTVIAGWLTLHREYLHHMRYPQLHLTVSGNSRTP